MSTYAPKKCMHQKTSTSTRSPENIVINQQVKPKILPSGHQVQQALFPVKEVEFDGVAMGVLSDGTPYLHLRGLARLCGVDHAAIHRLSANWDEEQLKPRGQKILELLRSQGFFGHSLFISTYGAGGETPAFTDAVCMALLEYYAFDAKQGNPETAQKNFRLLARKSFRQFIYEGCGYNPDAHIPESWRTFHERILLNDTVPYGHYSVFRETADLNVHMIKAGCPMDSHTILDGSIGLVWGNYWTKNGLDGVYGERLKHPHNFPNWFPQSVANPVPAWIYPIQSLGKFRVWLYESYTQTNLPNYLNKKVKDEVFLPARANAMLNAVQKAHLPPTLSTRT